MGNILKLDARSSALLNSTSLKDLNEGIDRTFGTLTQNSLSSDFITRVTQAFGNNFDAGKLNIITQDWSTRQFDSLPTIEIRSSVELKGARGVFSTETNTIYLAAEFVGTNVGNPTQISTVLLEEVGHWLDSKINRIDASGDEGAIFSALVSGQNLSSSQLSQLQAENDTLILNLDGKTISAEAANDAKDNLGLLSDKIDDLLSGVIAKIPTDALTGVPILGDIDTTSYVNQLFAGVLDKVKTIETSSVEKIQESLATAFNSLGILLDLDGDGDKDKDDIGLTQNNTEAIEFQFKLGKNFNPNQSIAGSLGLPALKLTGGVGTNLDLSLGVGFGVDKDGNVFLNTKTTNEFQIDLGAKLLDSNNNPLSVTGKIGFLDVSATDSGSAIKSKFVADLNSASADANGRLKVSDLATLAIDKQLTAETDINLKLNTGLGNGTLPSIETNFVISGWNYDSKDLNSINTTVAFKDVTLDAGSLVNNFTKGILGDINKVAKPINDILSPFAEDLPVIGASFLDIAKIAASLGGQGTIGDSLKFIEQLKKIADLFDDDTSGVSGKISLGDFTVAGSGAAASSVTIPPATTTTPLLVTADVLPSAVPDEPQFIKDLKTIGFEFPILDNPGTNLIDLLLGKPNVDLFAYQTPKFEVNFKLPSIQIPVFGPVVIKIDGNAGAGAQFRFGYDTTGFTNGNSANGFFVTKPNDGGSNLSANAFLGAGVGVSLGFASLTIGGGVDLNLGLNVFNSTNNSDKVRGSEIPSLLPFCLFKINGALSVIIFGELEIDFGFFEISQRLDLASIKLIDFEENPDCNSPDHFNIEDPEPSKRQQEALKAAGIIDREGTASNDNLIIENQGGGNVWLRGFPVVTDKYADPDKYEKVTLAVINGGDGNDTITFTNAVEAPGQVKGGAGNDTIVTGKGNDFLMGEQGKDFLDGKEGNNTVEYSSSPNGVSVNLSQNVASNDGFGTADTLANIQNVQGSGRNDLIIGNDGDNYLNGNNGNDDLQGLGGDDVLLGGNGADKIDGGSNGGKGDIITYLSSPAPVFVNLSSQNLLGNIVSNDSFVPLFLFANNGYGGEAEGDTIFNVENVSGSNYNDILVAGNGGGVVDGWRGNDSIYAGIGADKLIGGDGVDWLSYKLSNAGVSVSLKDNSFSGGYANGDKLQTIVYDANKKASIEDNNSFENLEGSFNDDGKLEGSDENNTIKGLSGNDSIFGAGGNDFLIGGAGADAINGGDGEDTASYLDSLGRVDVNLSKGQGLFNDADGDTLATVENLIGSNFDDVLVGDGTDNRINPSLSKGGTDSVDGAGLFFDRDTLQIDYSINDVGTGLEGGFNGFGTGDIKRYTDDTKTTILDRVTFTNIERLEVAGTLRNDSIVGGFNDDYLSMSDGNDFVDGGAGNDTLLGDYGIDTLWKDFAGKTDNIVLESFSIITETQNVTIFAAGSIVRGFEIYQNITTGEGSDTLTQLDRINNNFNTNGGNDTVNAGLGIDKADGGGGDDLLIIDYSAGDTGSEMIMFAPTRSFTDGYAYRSVNPNDVEDTVLDQIDFNNFERYKVTGTSKNDFIFLGDGTDEVNGGAGVDFLTGNRGNDILAGGDDSDLLKGTNNDNYGSSEFPDRPQDLDTLSGGTGGDVFVLGDTTDYYYGNAGGSDYAIITDFNPAEGDKIQLRNCAIEGLSFDRGYTIQEFTVFGFSAIYAERGQELIAILQGSGAFGLDFNAAYFEYLGAPCPPPPR
jgi:Ca2+-binding RTX toxin-like protein